MDVVAGSTITVDLIDGQQDVHITILDLIGRGGHATVVKGRLQGTGQLVALKMPRISLDSHREVHSETRARAAWIDSNRRLIATPARDQHVATRSAPACPASARDVHRARAAYPDFSPGDERQPFALPIYPPGH